MLLIASAIPMNLERVGAIMTWAKITGELTPHLDFIVAVVAVVVSGAVKIVCKIHDNIERRRGLEIAIKDTISADRASVVESYASCLKASRRDKEASLVPSSESEGRRDNVQRKPPSSLGCGS